MPLLPRLASLWRNLFRKARKEQELSEELDAYLELLIEQKLSEGFAPDEARRAALLELGGKQQVKEQVRAVRVGHQLETCWQDLRYALRMLRRNPGFASVAVLTLALGIGANTAIFSVVNAVLLRPLPYHEPDRLAMLWKENAKQNLHEDGTSILSFLDWRAQSQTFTDMAVFAGVNSVFLTSGEEPDPTNIVRASANLFPLLGVKPALGRSFSAEEEERRERVVVLSHGLWQRRFGSAADVIGKTLEINGQTSQVIGVLPAGFYFPTKEAQLWEPATLFGMYDRLRAVRGNDDWNVVGRLEPGATWRAAQAEMTAIDQRLAQAYPESDPYRVGINVVPLPLQVSGKSLRLALWVLWGAVTSVLLIACTNVANLLLARGAARGREFAVRAALGASRLRLLRQMLTESVLLALGAGLAGCAVAALGVRALVAFAPPGIPRLDEIRLDGAVLLFTAGLSLLAGLLFGLAPAWQVSEQRPNEALKEGSPSATGSLRLRQTRGLLVVGECALAVVLLAGAGLLVRSFLRLQAVEPGFKPEGVLLVQVSMLPSVGRKDISSLYQQLRERLRALPGVQAVGTIGDNRGAFPRTASPDGKSKIIVEGRSSASEQVSVTLVSPQVDPGFLPAIGAPLLKGRFYAEQDLPLPVPREFNAETVVLNETLARQLFHDADPIGRRISQDGDWQTVVGVVGDMRRQGLEQQPFAELYRLATPIYTWVMRTAGVDPLALGAPIRAAVRSADQSLTVTSVLPLKQRMAELTAERRFQTWLLALFSAVALTLAAIGIYGVMHYTVAQRTHELGIRIALGASRSDVLRLMIGQGMKLALLGVAVGLIVSLWLTRVLAHLLFGVSETDPATFGGVAILLAGVALLACYLPARKAAKVDPIAALRCE